ncbi:GNAT family N-acetyltransferase [Veronia nyctiphanis]|uniref:GNAT family N-acetyltransferase n=1 Tax=Veronia nyctiphanis TaxID=1278244 RepID=A0A4Q0YLZ7_9GAMM|nr:GNAT family N-acetyltransferase [Veronia nyctiphanis]RXJ71726.1 GNAT family N-acetyltransferase [Veronia nyctiphanis]
MEMLIDDLSGHEVKALLEEHLADMHATSPAESVHALDLSGLLEPSVTFWTCHSADGLLGCAALKSIDADSAEIKSMRTASNARGKGVASFMLSHILREAKNRSISTLSLETGTQPFFMPAHKLYEKFGFTDCGPFADYKPVPHSRFMRLTLSEMETKDRTI